MMPTVMSIDTQKWSALAFFLGNAEDYCLLCSMLDSDDHSMVEMVKMII